MGQAIRDESGKVLGYFLTEVEYDRVIYDAAKVESATREADRPFIRLNVLLDLVTNENRHGEELGQLVGNERW